MELSTKLLKSLLLFLYLTSSMYTCQATKPFPTKASINYTQYIKSSCNNTLYAQLCYKTLSKFAEKIQANPKSLANTSISVSLLAAKSTSKAMKNISKSGGLSPRDGAALHDCVELATDSVDELQRSMEQMNELADADPNFRFEMSNVQTWVSAVLTNYVTCMDGFAGNKDGNVKDRVKKYVVNVSHLTSIALKFINNYAAVG